MASITKRGKSFQAEVRHKGYPSVSKCFGTIKEAKAWALQQEALQNASESPVRAIREHLMPTLGEALKRYQEEVTVTKKSGTKELSFLNYWRCSDLSRLRLSQVSSDAVCRHRDAMLKAQRSPATVVRYLAVLSHMFTVARMDWGFKVANPVDGLRKPRVSNARSRRPSRDELNAILNQINSHEMRLFVLLAGETAMRRGELFKLCWHQVDLEKGFVHLVDTKNGDDRTVVISDKAKQYLAQLRASHDGKVFKFSHVDTPSKAFRRALLSARSQYTETCKTPSNMFLVNLRLHDMRHEATSSLFERGLSMPEVAAITGHKTLSMLARYTHLNAETFRNKLNLDIVTSNKIAST